MAQTIKPFADMDYIGPSAGLSLLTQASGPNGTLQLSYNTWDNEYWVRRFSGNQLMFCMVRADEFEAIDTFEEHLWCIN